MPNLKNDAEEFLTYAFRSTGEMFTYISESFGKTLSRPVHLFVLHPTEGVSLDDVVERASNRGLTFTSKLICDQLYRITIKVKKRAVHGFLIIGEGCWIFVSRGRGSVIRAVVIESLVNNHLFPHLQSSHIDVDEMLSIVDDLKPLYDGLVLEEYSMAGERGTLREWLRSGESFNINLASELQEKNNASFTGLKISGQTDGLPDAKFRIYTKNQLTFYSGSFGDMFEFVVTPFIERSLNSQRTYTGREMQVAAGKVSLFGVKISGKTSFGTKEIDGIRDFIRNSYSTVLVYHNPVTVLQATDKRDGSSFDVYLTSESIEVIPLSKSSPGALIELCASIVRWLPPQSKFAPIPPVETVFA